MSIIPIAMGTSRNYKRLVVRRLRNLIDIRGYSLAQLEKKLGRGRGFVGDALRGDKKLSFDVILDVLRVLRIDPDLFFSGRVEEEMRMEEMSRQLRKNGRLAKDEHSGRGRQSRVDLQADNPLAVIERTLTSAEPAPVKEMASVLWALVQLLESKGHLDQDELLALLREITLRPPAKRKAKRTSKKTGKSKAGRAKKAAKRKKTSR